jgi:hypothetical protein
MSLISVSLALVALFGGQIGHAENVTLGKSFVLARATIKESIRVTNPDARQNVVQPPVDPFVQSQTPFSVRRVERKCSTIEVVSPSVCVVTTIELP